MLENILLYVLAGMCALTLILYGLDKLKAIFDGWRIPERVLITFSLLGGGVGGLLAMLLFRHKTRHGYFYVVNVIGVIIDAVLLFFILR